MLCVRVCCIFLIGGDDDECSLLKAQLRMMCFSWSQFTPTSNEYLPNFCMTYARQEVRGDAMTMHLAISCVYYIVSLFDERTFAVPTSDSCSSRASSC
jgi:hypothetical protein